MGRSEGRYPNLRREIKITQNETRTVTGVKATAFGLGLNEVALTFNFCADVGLSGCVGGEDSKGLLSLGVVDFLPRKGGIVWITMLTRGMVFEVSNLLDPATADPLGTIPAEPGTALELLLEGIPAGFAIFAPSDGFRVISGLLGARFGGDFCVVLTMDEEIPIARACAD